MRLPFVHTVTAGLVITDAEVVWVSGERRGSRLHGVQCVHEAVEDGDVQAALGRLVSQVEAANAYVVTHLDALHVRHVIVQGPAFDEEEDFADWLEEEAKRHLPYGASPEGFAIRVQLLEETETYIRCLLALARREAATERLALLESAGIYLSGIVTLEMAAGEALRHRGLLSEGRQAVLLLRSDEGALLTYKDGILDELTPLSFGTETPDVLVLLEELARQMTPSPEGLYVMASAAGIASEMRALRLFDGPVHELSEDLASGEQGEPRSPLDVLAVGMALQHINAREETFNFIAPEASARRLQEVEKREAMRVSLVLGSLLGVLYLAVALVTVYLNGKQAASERALHALSDQVKHIERARAAVARLESDVAQAEALVTERTQFARVLEGMGRGVTDSLWLDTALLENVHLTLTGAAFHEEAVARYLEHLEHTPFAANVALSYAEALQARALYRQAALENQRLTRFELRLTLAAQATGVEGVQ